MMMKIKELNNFDKVKVTFIVILSIPQIILANIITPPDSVYNIKDFGATGNGKYLNTKVIQQVIDKASKNGGGKVLVPKGTFLLGGIILKSGVELHIQRGATLLGSTKPSAYKSLSGRLALILANGEKNISITGEGIIDGQGRKLALAVDSLYHMGKLKDPNYNHILNRPSEEHRPEIITFVECSNVQIKGVTLKNSSGWVQTYDLCENLKIDNIRVESTAFWNNDGIDVVDSKNVCITNSFINSADDGICLKSHHREEMNNDIYIADCIVRSSASGVKFGTASQGGFKNVKIENITVYDTFRSAVALESVDGGTLEDIEIENIRAINTGNAIFLRLGHRNTSGPVGELKNVSIKNIFVQVPFSRPDEEYDLRALPEATHHNILPASIIGIPGHKIKNITLENISIIYPGRASKGQAYKPLWRLNDIPEESGDYPEFSMFGELPAWGLYVRHVKGLMIKRMRLKVKEHDFRPAIIFDDVEKLKLENSMIIPTKLDSKQVILDSVRQALFQNNGIQGVQGDGIYLLKNNSEISRK